MSRLLFCLAGTAALALSACGQDADEAPDGEVEQAVATVGEGLPEAATRTPENAVAWAIATANPLATEAGARILERGGDAVDAAVAVQAVLGLVEPQSSGLGGGAFMLYYDAESNAITAYDGREVAPYSAEPDMFFNEETGQPMGFYDAVTSGRSVGVPGVVAMLDVAHSEHGQLEWEDLFRDAQRLARDGFEVSPRLSMLLGRTRRLVDDESARRLYYNEDGTPLAEGTLLRNPDYLDTLNAIASGGAGAFYTGEIAEAIVAAVNARAGEGTMSLEDLSAYTPIEREPICGPFLSYRICSMPPPSSGGVTVLQILGLAERAGLGNSSTAEGWTHYVEASRLAYADRNLYLADPISMGSGDVDADQITDALVEGGYLDSRARLIGNEAAPTVEPGDPTPAPMREGRAKDASPELPGTSHFSIMDGRGNIVSMTTTVEFAFGSHIMAGGMILNNQLTDFSFIAEQDGIPVVNAAGPGKRPRSSMAPVIVLDQNDEPVLVIGSPGGSAIIGYVAKTLMAALAWDLSLQAAIDLPNIVVPRGEVLVEPDIDGGLATALEAYGYELNRQQLTSGLYGFRLQDGQALPGVDPRREGSFRTAR
jgi:gamma-glutamyltranspeptidase/glutathione hydrolase